MTNFNTDPVAEITYWITTILPRMNELGYAGFAGDVDDDGNEYIPFETAVNKAMKMHGCSIPQNTLDYIIHSHCFKDDAVNAE